MQEDKIFDDGKNYFVKDSFIEQGQTFSSFQQHSSGFTYGEVIQSLFLIAIFTLLLYKFFWNSVHGVKILQR